jgi:hypothetical protein
LLRPCSPCGVEFSVALFDAASPFVSRKDDADWFGRAFLHAAAISCCVLPVARART